LKVGARTTSTFWIDLGTSSSSILTQAPALLLMLFHDVPVIPADVCPFYLFWTICPSSQSTQENWGPGCVHWQVKDSSGTTLGRADG